MPNPHQRSATHQRPLPQPSIASAPFWSSGEDGLLRIAECLDCGARHHPPQPLCRVCKSPKVEMTPVSGRAVIVGFTVNEQTWLPSFPPPYVIAVVALEEDDDARLTTNIVGCDAADVHIGQYVRVLFEKAADDVWVPLFEPDPDRVGELGELPEPEDYRAHLRQPVSSRRLEDQVAITGVGQSQVGRRLMVDPVSLTVDAVQKAVADAGLQMSDIDGLSTFPGGWGSGMTEGGATALDEALGIHPTWVNSGMELPGQIGSIITAMAAVASGLCRHVVCFRTVWQATESALQRSGFIHPSTDRATGMFEYRAPFGAMSAANWIGVNASHYMHRYGVGREAMGWIAVTERRHAGLNPEAVYREPITFDDYMSARMISSPFGLYDCDTPVDGAIAVIVSAIDVAHDMAKPPVLVEAIGSQVMERLSWDQGTLTHLPQSLGPAAHLWSRTDMTTDDVDVALLYDGFAFNAVSWLESFGFCGFGEAADFIDEGRTISLGGALPLNPHGGQLSAGRLHGYGFVREAVLQLRGEATGRQVEGAQVAAVSAGGGTPAGAMLLRR
jgi:acetyl-CoA acetyltransferase/uncharacterized OB-fold protein